MKHIVAVGAFCIEAAGPVAFIVAGGVVAVGLLYFLGDDDNETGAVTQR